MSDLGFTHVALPVSNVDASIAFYSKYARMQVVHRRSDQTTQSDVVWLSDLTRPFAIVLIEVPKVEKPLLPIAHLGVACETREEVDRLCDEARSDGLLQEGPNDNGYPVGYWAFISDPDGHTLEVSYGQEITFTFRRQKYEGRGLLCSHVLKLGIELLTPWSVATRASRNKYFFKLGFIPITKVFLPFCLLHKSLLPFFVNQATESKSEG